jgi:hypothetical protein
MSGRIEGHLEHTSSVKQLTLQLGHLPPRDVHTTAQPRRLRRIKQESQERSSVERSTFEETSIRKKSQQRKSVTIPSPDAKEQARLLEEEREAREKELREHKIQL